MPVDQVKQANFAPTRLQRLSNRHRIGGVAVIEDQGISWQIPDACQHHDLCERRFVWQVRTAIIVVGLTGFYMVGCLHL